MLGQPSTNPNKAFWEAICLVGILLAVLLFSVLHIKGWLPGADKESVENTHIPASVQDRAPDTPAPVPPPAQLPVPETAPQTPEAEPEQQSPPEDRNRGPPGGPAPGGGKSQLITKDSIDLAFPDGNVRIIPDPSRPGQNIHVTVRDVGPEGWRTAARGVKFEDSQVPNTHLQTAAPLQGGQVTDEALKSPQHTRIYDLVPPQQQQVDVQTDLGRLSSIVPLSAAPGQLSFDYVPWQRQGVPVGQNGQQSGHSERIC